MERRPTGAEGGISKESDGTRVAISTLTRQLGLHHTAWRWKGGSGRRRETTTEERVAFIERLAKGEPYRTERGVGVQHTH